MRGIVVSNEDKNITLRGPVGIEKDFTEAWVEELISDNVRTPSGFPQPPNAQDLNEHESALPFYISDYIYIGYYED